MCGERGQASIEWVGLLLLATLVLGVLATVVPVVDGRSLGGFISHHITCTVREDCAAGDDALRAAYGAEDAELVRRYAPSLVYEPGEPSLPVDYRACRSVRCAAAPDDRSLDAHRTDAGLAATAFTHVVRKDGRTYLQYYLYYPDSNTKLGSSDAVWNKVARAGGPLVGKHPYHLDDWEGYQVRVEADGTASVRATSHGSYQWCKQRRCKGRWGPHTGWTRVSSGSHAGHIPLRRDDSRAHSRYGVPRLSDGRKVFGYRVPALSDGPTVLGYRPGPVGYAPEVPGRDFQERTSSASGLRLVPLERVDRGAYRPLDDTISPPWRKKVYDDPESDDS